MMTDRGIACSVHFKPLHLHPYWRDRYSLKPDDFPNAVSNYERAISLPLFTKLNSVNQERVIDSIKAILR